MGDEHLLLELPVLFFFATFLVVSELCTLNLIDVVNILEKYARDCSKATGTIDETPIFARFRG